MSETGQLEKLTILAFADENFDIPQGNPYVALLNPEEITFETRVDYAPVNTPGEPKQKQKYNTVQSPKLQLKLLFDNTGVISTVDSKQHEFNREKGDKFTSGGNKSTTGSVDQQIEAFKRVTFDFASEIRRPFYVGIYWGTRVFKGQLDNLKITYKLFRPDGTPLRAIGEASFIEFLDPKSYEAIQKAGEQTSRIVDVKTKTLLASLCIKFYGPSKGGDPKLQKKVAKINGLGDSKWVPRNKELYFPPAEMLDRQDEMKN